MAQCNAIRSTETLQRRKYIDFSTFFLGQRKLFAFDKIQTLNFLSLKSLSGSDIFSFHFARNNFSLFVPVFLPPGAVTGKNWELTGTSQLLWATLIFLAINSLFGQLLMLLRVSKEGSATCQSLNRGDYIFSANIFEFDMGWLNTGNPILTEN